jgi:acetolactate synthase-1/3 small subunit/acetolactate synthase II small subunit
MQLQISFRPAEGAVVRILGLIERRGFILRAIAVRAGDPDGAMRVDVAPRDPQGRRLDVLARQVARLIDVRSVATEPAAGPNS